MVGVIMIVGLLITPAALAYLMTDRLPRMMALAAAMGVLSVVLGLYFSEWVNASGGGSIMFTGFLLFLAGLVAAPRYGLLAAWLRRRRLVPQSDIEDVLKAAYEGRVPATVPLAPARVRKAARRMASEGLLAPGPLAAGTLELTPQGRTEAQHIMRSHQLWEGHLLKAGLAPEAAHAAAERLEHLHERRDLDRFDDELGHPLEDVHGVPVPGEVVEESGELQALTLSLLREGDRGRFVACRHSWPTGLRNGMTFTVGPRHGGGEEWSVVRDGGSETILSHGDADALFVQRLPGDSSPATEAAS
jgi:manganese/iron transport system permease protein/iron/zinc/copper transport system permease protein